MNHPMNLESVVSKVASHDAEIDALTRNVESLATEVRKTNENISAMGNGLTSQIVALRDVIAGQNAVNWPLIISIMGFGLVVIVSCMGGILWLSTTQATQSVSPLASEVNHLNSQIERINADLIQFHRDVAEDEEREFTKEAWAAQREIIDLQLELLRREMGRPPLPNPSHSTLP